MSDDLWTQLQTARLRFKDPTSLPPELKSALYEVAEAALSHLDAQLEASPDSRIYGVDLNAETNRGDLNDALADANPEDHESAYDLGSALINLAQTLRALESKEAPSL